MKNTWRFGEKEFKYLREVLASGKASGTLGNLNNRFEKAFSKKVEAKYAITFNSGTSTLHAALDAVGVEAGDEVIIDYNDTSNALYEISDTASQSINIGAIL